MLRSRVWRGETGPDLGNEAGSLEGFGERTRSSQHARSTQIDDELMLALERWEELGKPG